MPKEKEFDQWKNHHDDFYIKEMMEDDIEHYKKLLKEARSIILKEVPQVNRFREFLDKTLFVEKK